MSFPIIHGPDASTYGAIFSKITIISDKLYRQIFKPLLFSLNPESAHHLSVALGSMTSKSALGRGLLSTLFSYEHPLLAQKIGTLYFPNPIGLAAGFDKNAELTDLMSSFGFGFLEIGSVTANSSNGNPKPRSFRLPADEALINRMGLNNDGAEIVSKRLQKTRVRIPLGINIAKTHDPNIMGSKAIDDYCFSFEKLQSEADYITINVSCPNTEEGKTFEDPTSLTELLSALIPLRNNLEMPIFVKLSVDLGNEEIRHLAKICLDLGADGFVVSNTSSGRSGLQSSEKVLQRIGRGGLSGKPVQKRSTELIAVVREFVGPNIPIIGVGGVDSMDSALEKIVAGANLIQIYTGMVYQGPSIIKNIKKQLVRRMESIDIACLDDFR